MSIIDYSRSAGKCNIEILDGADIIVDEFNSRLSCQQLPTAVLYTPVGYSPFTAKNCHRHHICFVFLSNEHTESLPIS